MFFHALLSSTHAITHTHQYALYCLVWSLAPDEGFDYLV